MSSPIGMIRIETQYFWENEKNGIQTTNQILIVSDYFGDLTDIDVFSSTTVVPPASDIGGTKDSETTWAC